MEWSWQLLWWVPAFGLALLLADLTAKLRHLARRQEEHDKLTGEELARIEVDRGKARPDRHACLRLVDRD